MKQHICLPFKMAHPGDCGDWLAYTWMICHLFLPLADCFCHLLSAVTHSFPSVTLLDACRDFWGEFTRTAELLFIKEVSTHSYSSMSGKHTPADARVLPTAVEIQLFLVRRQGHFWAVEELIWCEIDLVEYKGNSKYLNVAATVKH